jgi:heat-inducible transcriptional repressor
MRQAPVARGIRHSAGPLDHRAQAILRAVIEEYTSSAAPVGSQTLVERYRLQVSSATVRAVLAELEMEGLLFHPHTSAGRVPTDAGYRFYVESLMGEAPISPIEQLMIRHQFGQVEFATDQWFRLAATTLASATRSAGIATPAKPRAARIRRFELVPIGDRMASLIIVLNEGTLKQTLFTLDAGTRVEDIEEAVRRLNASCSGRSAADVAEHLRWFDQAPADDAIFSLVRRAGDRALRLLREFDADTVEQLFSDGLLNVMAAPEFASSEKLRRVFEALENRSYFAELFDTVTVEGGLRVYIGRENRPEEMADVSLVLAPYGRPGAAVGFVGVLGPTRLRYPQAIGTVRFVSSLMNDLVDHLYA